MTTKRTARLAAVLPLVAGLTLVACGDDADDTPQPANSSVDAPPPSDPPDDGNGALDGDGDDGNGALDGDGDDGNGALDGDGDDGNGALDGDG